MMKIIYISLITFIIYLPGTFSQIITELKPRIATVQLPFGLTEFVPEPKPIVAIALSGGGARGFSQAGVLRALEEANIEFDMIVGTSMGSIIGGLYASGYTIDELDSIALDVNWNDLLTLSRQTDRKELFVDQKITEDRAVITLRLDGFRPVLPTAFNDGQKFSNYLNIITFNAPLHQADSFDLLKIKFRAVCTNLVTGDPVILKSGTLSNALRASSSVTFFLPPVHVDSLILVDGGLVENIPVNTAKKEGAEFIIAVNTTSPLHKAERLDVPWIIADQSVSIPMKHLNSYQLDSADYVITPNLNDHSANNFNQIEDMILTGYQSTLPHIAAIKQKIDSIYLHNIADEEVSFINPVLNSTFDEKEILVFNKYIKPDSVSNKQLLAALYELQSSGRYSNIKIIVTENDSKSEIQIIKDENPIIKRVDLIGSSAINSEVTGKIFSPIYNQHYTGKRVLNSIILLLREYRKIGYSLANISEVRFEPDIGRLIIFIDEGIISSIITEGNYYTNDNIITREFPIKTGDFFNIDKISRGLTNLRSTKLFDDAEVIIKKDNGKNVIVLRVIERHSSLLRLGFSIDNENRARVVADIREENLFGSGTELGFLFFAGSLDRGVMLEQKSNRIFNTYITYKINAFYNFNDVSVYRDRLNVPKSRISRERIGKYRQIFYGASLGIGAQAERFGNIIFEGKYLKNRLKNIEESPTEPFNITIVSIRASSTIDTQDKYPYPGSGIYFNGFYETAQTFLGGNVGYTNVGFEYRNYISFGEQHTFFPGISMGFGDKTLPLTQQYSLGGMNSFYGMRDYEYRGRQLFLASLTYRYKLPVSIFFDTYFLARYDLGNVWEIQEQIKFKNLKHGIGAALSLDTPIGPAEFAIGRSFLFRKDIPDNPLSWGDVRFYFSIGYYY